MGGGKNPLPLFYLTKEKNMSLSSAIRAEAEKNFEIQRWKRFAVLGRSLSIPANSSQDMSIDVGQSGDFSCKELSCKIVPTNSSTYSGLTVEIWDNQKANLTDGPIPLELLATPGYGVSRNRVQELTHTFERSGKIKVTIVNTSAETQKVHIGFIGERLQ